MNIAIDIETEGLDATKYILGAIAFERKKPEVYHTKEELWNRVLELKERCKKQNQILKIYHHNANFDTAGYVDYTDKHIEIYSTRPYIMSYKEERKEKAKFLDTYNLYKTSLKKNRRKHRTRKKEL